MTMLTLHESMETTGTVTPTASQAFARPDTSFAQLKFDFLDLPEQISDDIVLHDESPIIRRLSDLSWFAKMRQLVEENPSLAPDWNWEKFLLDVAGNLPLELERIWRKSLDEDVKIVAMHVAQDQPLQHKELKYCPTYCPVSTFGPNARGPPFI